MSLIIYSNLIKTGKSTNLFNWCYNQSGMVQGFIMKEENGQKVVCHAADLQVYSPSINQFDCNISIGNYRFNNDIFLSATNYAKSCFQENNFDIFCLDEIGKLELNNQGWHHCFESLLVHEQQNKSKQYIVIIRSSLLENVIEKYKINDYFLVDLL